MFRFGVVFLSILLFAGGTDAAESDPASGAAPEPDPAAVIAELPFERPDVQNRIYVELAPKGTRSLMLMLDTGADFSAMTPRTARALGISVRRTKSSPYRRATLLGRDLQFWVDSSISDTAAPVGWEYGLLGGNFLQHYVVELDFQQHRVRFLDPKRYRVPERAASPEEAVLPIRMTAMRPFTTIEVDGTETQVLIDTGAPLTVYLSGKEARKIGLDPGSLPYYGEMGTTVGDTPGHIGEAHSLRFAGFDLGRTPIVVMPRGWFNIVGSSNSVIGYDVLQQFKLRIDYPRGRLWLKRRSDARVTFDGTAYESIRGRGVYLGRVPGRGWWVLSVMPDSPAERFGLKRNDVIVGWEGAISTPGIEETIERIEAGVEVVVARRDRGGEWHPVTLGRAAVVPSPAPRGAAPADADASGPPGAAEASAPVKEAPDPRPAPTAEEQRAEWQERMNERLFVFENGGWAVVDGWRRRMGPKEGEVWVTYDEMREMKRTGRVPEGAEDR